MRLTTTIPYIGVGFCIFIGFTCQQALVSYFLAFRLLEKLIHFNMYTFVDKSS